MLAIANADGEREVFQTVPHCAQEERRTFDIRIRLVTLHERAHSRFEVLARHFAVVERAEVRVYEHELLHAFEKLDLDAASTGLLLIVHSLMQRLDLGVRDMLQSLSVKVSGISARVVTVQQVERHTEEAPNDKSDVLEQHAVRVRR